MARRAHLGLACALLGACGPAPPPTAPAPASTQAAAPPQAPRGPREGQATVFFDTERTDRGSDHAFSRDGSLIAVEAPPQTIALHTTATGERRASVGAPGDVLEIGFRADGGAFWAVCALGAAAWDVSGAPLFAVEAPSTRERRRASWSPSGERLAVLDGRGALRLVDGRTAAVLWQVEAGDGALLEMWGAASDVVVTARDGAHTLWSAGDGARLGELPPPPRGWALRSLAPDARTALVVSDDENRFRFVDALSGNVRAERRLSGRVAYQSPNSMTAARLSEGGAAQIGATAWSPDGTAIAIAHDPPDSIYGMYVRYYDVAVHDARTGRRRHALRGAVNGGLLAWSRDGSRVYGQATASADVEDLAWDAATGARVKERVPPALARSGTPDPTWSYVASLSGKDLLIQALPDRKALWSVPVELPARFGELEQHPHAALCAGAPRALFTTPEHRGAIFRLAPESGTQGGLRTDLGDITALGCGPRAWSALGAERGIGARMFYVGEDGALQRMLVAGRAQALPALSPDGARLAVARTDERVELLDARTGDRLHETRTGYLRGVSWSPDGSTLAVRDAGGLRVLDAQGAQRALVPLAGFAWSAVFRADGRLLVSDPAAGRILLLGASGAVERTFSAPAVLAWSPDGARMTDGAAIWEIEPGRAAATLAAPVEEAVFSPDGTRVAGRVGRTRVGVFRAADGAEERSWPAPEGASLLGWTDDGALVFLGTATGVRVLRRDGAWMRGDVVGQGTPEVVWSLDSGHFDGTSAALAHARVFAPGALGQPFVLERGPGWERFHRPRVHEDMFPPR